MKKNFTTIIFGIIFLAGLSLLLYPFVANEWNTYRQSRLISGYSEAVSEQVSDGQINAEEVFQEAYSYNDALLPSILPDSFVSL